MAVANGGKKASFTNLCRGKTFFVQFNPSEFQLSEKASYQKSDEQQRDKPALQYKSGDPTTVKMKLVFDSTDTGSDVDSAYIQELRSFMTASEDRTDSEGNKRKEPPYCRFTWNTFNFDCVVEQVAAKYLMFSPDGVALRAEVDVTLKERDRALYQTSGNSQGSIPVLSAFSYSGSDGPAYRTYSNGSAATHIVRSGDTVPSVAAEHGVPWRAVAAANGIWDPTALEPGTTIIIPGDPAMAAVLAAHQLEQAEGNPLPDPIGPFGAPSPSVHELQDPEVFDEALEELGAEFNSALAIGEYGDGSLDPLDSGSAVQDFFAEAAESGERPDMATWEAGFSDAAVAEYLGADIAALEGGSALQDFEATVQESGPAPEMGVFEGGPSDAAMSEYEGADIEALESASASEGSSGASNENVLGGTAVQEHEANVVEGGPAPEAATFEGGPSADAADEGTGATNENALGGSAVQEHEANVVEGGPAPEAATFEGGPSADAADEGTGATNENVEGGSAVQEHTGELAESGPAPEAATSEAQASEAAASAATEAKDEGMDSADAIKEYEGAGTMAEKAAAKQAARAEAAAGGEGASHSSGGATPTSQGEAKAAAKAAAKEAMASGATPEEAKAAAKAAAKEAMSEGSGGPSYTGGDAPEAAKFQGGKSASAIGDYSDGAGTMAEKVAAKQAAIGGGASSSGASASAAAAGASSSMAAGESGSGAPTSSAAAAATAASAGSSDASGPSPSEVAAAGGGKAAVKAAAQESGMSASEVKAKVSDMIKKTKGK